MYSPARHSLTGRNIVLCFSPDIGPPYPTIRYDFTYCAPSLPIRLTSRSSESILPLRFSSDGSSVERHFHLPSSSMRLAHFPPLSPQSLSSLPTAGRLTLSALSPPARSMALKRFIFIGSALYPL